MFAFSADGHLLVGWPTQADDAVIGTPTLADLDSDGDVEVIVCDMDAVIRIWDVSGEYALGYGVQWASFRNDFKRSGRYDGVPIGAGVPDGESLPTVTLALEQNRPNPFNPLTSIAYSVPENTAEIELSVYDVTGRLVRTVASGKVVAGRHEAVWDGRDARGERVASGVYFVRLTDGKTTATKRMVLLK